MIKNYLRVIEYDESSIFFNRKIDFDIIKPISKNVITKIKGKFFSQDFNLSNDFERMRISAAFAKVMDDAIPRQSEKVKSFSNLMDAIRNLKESMENFDAYTSCDLLAQIEEEIPGIFKFVNNESSECMQKILHVIKKNIPSKDVGGRKPQNLKLIIIGWLLSIYMRGTNKEISINYNQKDDLYYGDTFDFLLICNECLELELGGPHAIVKIAKLCKNSRS